MSHVIFCISCITGFSRLFVILIRSARDDFVSIVARCNVEEDAHPQWRRLAWNKDASMLAYSDSRGEKERLPLFLFDRL